MAIHQAMTRNGMVSGVPGGNPGITVFKGIPYAAPPVGENRWRAPQPVKDWEGVRKADRFRGFCPQEEEQSPMFLRENPKPFEEMDEDCLYLNVWTPAHTQDEKLPVVMWIHGGANVRGWGHQPSFDGEGFARRGVILVTFNWRVNIFGWLAHPELSEENPDHISGNYGVLDQVAALHWIRDNIAAFGGDPDNITVAGESAGASSTMNLCCTPLTAGLFKHAVMQSGGGFDLFSSTMIPTLKMAEKTVDLKKCLQVDSIREARKLDAGEIVRRMSRPEAAGAYLPMQVVDGVVFDGTITDICKAGNYHKIDYIIGFTKDETGMYELPEDREFFLKDVRDEYGAYADRYLELCDFLKEDEAFRAHLKVRSAEQLKTGALVFAELLEEQGHGPVYMYCFDRQLPGDDAGAYHSSELWYLFETLNRSWRPFTGKDFELSRAMADYWCNFAKTGDPNGGELPLWESYRKEDHRMMELGLSIGMKDFGENDRVKFRKDFVMKRV